MSMNPRITTDKIRNDYQEYITSILNVRDEEITKLAHKAVNEAGFVKGPFLETTLPFEEGKSLKELAEEGLVSSEFGLMGDSVHYEDWKLRIHQENALRHIIKKKRNMVVSTGTGSGKTECYLYPIFNALMREKEAGTLGPGVRALLIFPMNALANDQQKKLRKLLKNYPDITFGRYTGETKHKTPKETPEEAEIRLHEQYDSDHIGEIDEVYRKSIKNELMCREMMAKEPPHILLTNYAMLEYMLLQPDTAPFFDNENAANWQFIVIDEAHTYKGANGTEIAYLLRRVKERLRHTMKKPFRCIATSATLGSSDSEGLKGLSQFAQNLFGEEFSAEDVITTKRIDRKVPHDGCLFNSDEYIELKEETSGMSEYEKGGYLYDRLQKDLRLYKLYSVLKNGPKSIDEVADYVFDDLAIHKERESALINLIELAAAAKKSDFESALLPARYHLFVKSLEGMFVQYYPMKMVYLDRKEKGYYKNRAYSVFELANCQKCNQEYIVGRMADMKNGSYLVQSSGSVRPEFYFVSNDTEESLISLDEDDDLDQKGKLNKLQKYHLCLCCGRMTAFAEKVEMDCCDSTEPGKIVTVYRLGLAGKDNQSNTCPCCGSTRQGLIRRFLTANQPATFAIAKSLYDAIPPRPIKSSKEDVFTDDIFGDFFEEDDNDEKTEMPPELIDESGRKLLIFSDNRQEAAFFAGFFEKKYNLIMWRKVIINCLKETSGKALLMPDLITRVVNTAEKAGLYTIDLKNKTNLTDDQKRELAILYIMQEFVNPEIGTGLEGLGFIEVRPMRFKFNSDYEVAGLKGDDLWKLIRFLMDTLREKGATNFPEPVRATNEFLIPKNHVGYFRREGTKIERQGHIYGFIPQIGRMNKRLGVFVKLLNDETRAREELEKLYKLIILLKEKGYIVSLSDPVNGTMYQLNYAKWEVRYVESDEKVYRCDKCGRVYSYSVIGRCTELKCTGELKELTKADVESEEYYRKMFYDKQLIPMVCREHTAQLASRTAGEYQENFEKGIINVLSCSTTFEMGVDVGELEATFQRNVPPETSNYIQRAGRAGRRTSSAAFSVTFSRRNSHDMTFFNEPAEIIAGKIAPPILEIDNEKIAERHMNSVIISWFFKKHPEYFTGNVRQIVSGNEPDNMSAVLKKELETHPEDLLTSIKNVLPLDVYSSLEVDTWKFIEDIAGDDGTLTRAIIERSTDIDGLLKFAVELMGDEKSKTSREQLNRAIYAKKLVSTIESEAAISFLSGKGVLPKYGFPVDSVSLDILSGSDEEKNKIDLSRDLKMAISEFAPPAKIVANGKVWESYAIKTIPKKGWPAYVYHECPKCKKIYHPEGQMVDVTVNLDEEPKKYCDYCDTLMNPRVFIIPIFGFSTQSEYKPKVVGESKPSSYYATHTQFWGIEGLTEKQKAEADEKNIEFNGKSIKAIYSPGGKLFVLNQGTNGRGLRVCPTCGFAYDPTTEVTEKSHKTKMKYNCNNKHLITVSLGHEFSTDILKITLPEYKSKKVFPESVTPKDQKLSVLFALLEGASKALGISRSDISGCVTEKQELVLFDDTAGGSGFVKSIYKNFNKVLRESLNKVAGSCGCGEETSCYGCLRNYSNQYYHDEISRGLAQEYINWLLNSSEDSMEYQVTKHKEMKPLNEIVMSVPKQEETIGSKELVLDMQDTKSAPDIVSAINSWIDTSEDEETILGYQKMLQAIADNSYEHPSAKKSLPAKEKTIWASMVFPKSRVALFTSGQESSYKVLKKYNWYCYMVNSQMDAVTVLSHIVKGE